MFALSIEPLLNRLRTQEELDEMCVVSKSNSGMDSSQDSGGPSCQRSGKEEEIDTGNTPAVE